MCRGHQGISCGIQDTLLPTADTVSFPLLVLLLLLLLLRAATGTAAAAMRNDRNR
jgi:hypothetical protein